MEKRDEDSIHTLRKLSPLNGILHHLDIVLPNEAPKFDTKLDDDTIGPGGFIGSH
jgi:hypothetical protein